MHDIRKNQINRFLQRFGVRVLKSPYYKFPYDQENFRELCSLKNLVVFDIGANIGQSSIWFMQNFPTAEVYAFEPFPTIFRHLKENTRKYTSIKPYKFALGNEDKTLKLPKIINPFDQTAQVIETLESMTLEQHSVEIVRVKTLDEFCFENSINMIHILKTDTEGSDIEVLEGGKTLLKQGRIMNILSEASICPDDRQHTNLFRLREFLAKYDFELFSLYDLHHNRENGRLSYFNALFKATKKSA